MSLGPILAATIATSDLGRSLPVYKAGLGLDEIESGGLPEAIAAAWGAPELAGARWVGLAGDGDEIGAIRLVETGRPFPDIRPLASLGWAATEISVQGVDARAEAMAAAGFTVLSAPLPLASNPSIKAAQFGGPDGEAIYVTDLRTYQGKLDLRRAERPVDRCFIAVLAAGDLEAVRARYETSFGTSRVSDRPLVVPALTTQLGLAPGEMVRISSQQLSGGCLLEIDGYPASTPARPTVKGLPGGVAMMSFAGPVKGPPGPAAWPYRGRPVEVRRGAGGELIELIGAPA